MAIETIDMFWNFLRSMILFKLARLFRLFQQFRLSIWRILHWGWGRPLRILPLWANISSLPPASYLGCFICFFICFICMFNKDHIVVGNLTSYCFIHLIIFWLAKAEPEMYHELSQSPDRASFPSNFPVSWVWVILSNHIFGPIPAAKDCKIPHIRFWRYWRFEILPESYFLVFILKPATTINNSI